ncbi:hypothetical protein BJ912DRAFT_933937 [Pholiota molesta]|nr:hypothetical protein BJ912DRAFT_933937 [Pholiota molesta]
MNNFTPLGPYTIAEINEAATFVMQIQFSVNMAASYLTPGAVASPAAAATAVGSSMIPAPYAVNKTGLTLAPSQSYATPTPPAVKEESPLPTILAQIGTALERLTARMEQGSGSTTRYTQNSSDQDCNFCGGPHFIRDCPIVDDYTRAGKCKRNAENKASAMMLNASSPNAIYTQSTEPQPPVRLSVADQVAYHQSAIFKLESRSAGFTPIIKMRNQRQQEASEETSEPVPGPARSTAAPTILTRDPPPHLPAAQSTSRTASARPATPPPAPAASSGLEHPYHNANDAAYAPPQTRNVGAPADKANAPRRDPTYRTLPPVHDPAIAVKIFNQSLETPVTITQRELLSLAPEVRSQYREATTIRRQPSKEATPTTVNLFDSIYANDMAPMPVFNLSVIESYAPEEDEYYERLDYSQFVNADGINGQPPPRVAAIIGDHYDLYYRTLAPGERPDFGMLTVAVESAALRSLHAVVDGTLRVECVIDPGSTIIAMSEEQSTALNLAYDPTIVLKMQSANGAIDPSLGLARNVPFLIGEVTVYLQVHIIRHAPYDVLFGRPFDIITSSVVRNYANEDQTLTIKDVNTGNTATARSSPSRTQRPRGGFSEIEDIEQHDGDVALTISVDEHGGTQSRATCHSRRVIDRHINAATQRIFTAMALALAWDNAARALAWGRAARTRVRKRSSGYSLDQCRASNPVNTHWNDSAPAIQWIFTGVIPRSTNPVNVHRIDAAQPSLWTYIFLDRSRGTMPVILCICHASGCAVLSDASARAALPHARGRHSSGYPQDRSRGTDLVNIHWIAHGAPFQWISTGFLRQCMPLHAPHCLTHAGVIPVDIHCIARAAPLQWISTGFFTRLCFSGFFIDSI